MLVRGTGGGAPREPDWFRNVRSTERAEIQVRDRHLTARVRVVEGEERDRVWRDVVLARVPEGPAGPRVPEAADVLGQGVVAVVAAVGGVAIARSLGVPRPDRWITVAVVPVPERLPVFPYGPLAAWEASRRLGAGAGLVALGALALGMVEASWWVALRRRPSAGRP